MISIQAEVSYLATLISNCNTTMRMQVPEPTISFYQLQIYVWCTKRTICTLIKIILSFTSLFWVSLIGYWAKSVMDRYWWFDLLWCFREVKTVALSETFWSGSETLGYCTTTMLRGRYILSNHNRRVIRKFLSRQWSAAVVLFAIQIVFLVI